MGSKALTKVQSVVLMAIVVVATAGGGAAYLLWSASQLPPEDIRIGVCGDLDQPGGKNILQAVILAAEQVNAEGGILGRNFTIVVEDDDSTSGDLAVSNNAFTKLITIDNAEYVIDSGTGTFIPHIDIGAEHHKIMFATSNALDDLAQMVLDDYNRYKYFFRVRPNATSGADAMLNSILTLGNYTDFDKVAILAQDNSAYNAIALELSSSLPRNGFDIVYNSKVATTVTDFASYFAAVEASGAQILIPMISGQAAISFAKEYTSRQSPLVVWGSMAAATSNTFWSLTEGKCEYISSLGQPISSGYPLTNKTVQTREAYIQRWGAIPEAYAAYGYDLVRFILPDAIKRAGTTETEAVIKALETTDVETSLARRFVFTSSHDVMVGAASPNGPAGDYMLFCEFQWQNGTQVLVYPKEIMEEAGATYKYPPWQGPWSK